MAPSPGTQLVAMVAELGPVDGRARRSPTTGRPSFPCENFHDFRDRGLLALCVPRQHGGLGAGLADYMRVSEEIGRHCGATALTFNMHVATMLWTGPVADLLDMTDEQRDRHERIRAVLFRGVVEDGKIHSQPFSEGVSPGATSGVATRAVPVDGGFLVTGRKIFASLSGAADFYNVTRRWRARTSSASSACPPMADGVRIEGDVGSARHAGHGLAHAGDGRGVRAGRQRVAARPGSTTRRRSGTRSCSCRSRRPTSA